MKQVTTMPKTSKLAISLPEDMLNAIEKESAESGESRSQVFRRAVGMLLPQKTARLMSDQYIRAYQLVPDTKEEVIAARHSASIILAGEPWQ
jgi:metal-responsive CopG/Arc/MetJ family transcriptional regulator